MTPDLDALDALLAAATPGPWRVSKHNAGTVEVPFPDAPVRHANGRPEWHRIGDFDEVTAALIVAAVNALPALIEAARREAALVAEITAWREAARPLLGSDIGSEKGRVSWKQLEQAIFPLRALARALLHDNAGASERGAE